MRVPLKTAATLVTEGSASGARPYLALEHIASGTGQLLPGTELAEREPAPHGMVTVRPGDVLFGKLRPYLAKVHHADAYLFASTELMCLRPTLDVHPRWLYYLCLSKSVVEWAVATAEGVKMPRTNWEKFREFRLEIPRPEKQRAIVNFLDRETSRIDALISARRRMLGLVEERRVRRLASLLRDGAETLPDGWRVLPIRRLCPDVTVGVVVDPSSYFRPSGIPFIHGSDVREGWIDESQFKFLSQQDNATLWKSRLAAGDVIAMRVGEPGRSAVIPPHLNGANCASVLIFRKSPDLASEILSAFLNSPQGKAQIASFQYGAAQGVMNVEHAMQLRVPVPPPEDQSEIAALLHQNESQAQRIRAMLTRQIQLLAERRHTLVSAAVTGQLDIPSAA